MGLEKLGREDILIRLKQASYFRAVEMTGHDIDPDDVVVFEEDDGTNIIMPTRSRYPIWNEEGDFEEYEYEPWVWVECLLENPFAGRLVMRQPVHQATFIVFPDWMTMDGANVSPEVLEAIIMNLWLLNLQRGIESCLGIYKEVLQ